MSGPLAGDDDRLANPYPPVVGQYRFEQLPGRMAWTRLDDEAPPNAAAQIIHIVPSGSSTVTVVNPTDPDPDGYRLFPWPTHSRPVPAGRT